MNNKTKMASKMAAIFLIYIWKIQDKPILPIYIGNWNVMGDVYIDIFHLDDC